MSLLLLLQTPTGGSGTFSFTLNDTINLSAEIGSFDTTNLLTADASNLSILDAISQGIGVNKGDTISLLVTEGISAAITAPTAQALSDTASLSVSDSVTLLNAFGFADSIGISIGIDWTADSGTITADSGTATADGFAYAASETISALVISPQSLSDTANISIGDFMLPVIGNITVIDASGIDVASLAIMDSLSSQIIQEVLIRHITFVAEPDHMIFSA